MDIAKSKGVIEGINHVVFSGNVTSVTIGKTSKDVPAFSMLIAVDQRNGETLLVRANSYGTLGLMCGEKINQRDYVVVEGELMDRKKSNDDNVFLEVRIRKIIFHQTLLGKILTDEYSQINNDGVDNV